MNEFSGTNDRAYTAPADTRSGDHDQHPDIEHGGHREQAGTDLHAVIAREDQLPSRDESRAQVWGDDPDDYDEDYLAGMYDGDLQALIAREDELPGRDESRVRTWGKNPGYVGEADLANGYGEPLETERAVSEDNDPATLAAPDERAVTETGQLHERHTAPAVNPETKKSESSARTSTSWESRHGTADSGAADRESTADRSPADGNAGTAELDGRHGRLEQASGEHAAEPIRGKELGIRENVQEKKLDEHRWRRPSDARLNLGAAVVGSGLAEAADFISAGPVHHAIGIVGTVVSIGVAAVLDARDKRKDKHARTPER